MVHPSTKSLGMNTQIQKQQNFPLVKGRKKGRDSCFGLQLAGKSRAGGDLQTDVYSQKNRRQGRFKTSKGHARKAGGKGKISQQRRKRGRAKKVHSIGVDRGGFAKRTGIPRQDPQPMAKQIKTRKLQNTTSPGKRGGWQRGNAHQII